ncbi:MAG: hypothetical protein H0T73_00455 [Ardenticatenales bacterium]|nr:hypothetical protein [Ardenticatenales bacterium]
MAQQCEMIVGYLVPHRCDSPALGRCIQCGRGYCETHLSLKPEGMICLACEQGLAQPVALPITAQNYDSTDFLIFESASRWDQDESDMFSDLS